VRERNTNSAPFPEFIVNLLGYEHLQQTDMRGAVEIMKLNAAAYPNSPNAFDSLSDAYLADGRKVAETEATGFTPSVKL
jgi:hypothetical protein